MIATKRALIGLKFMRVGWVSMGFLFGLDHGLSLEPNPVLQGAETGLWATHQLISADQSTNPDPDAAKVLYGVFSEDSITQAIEYYNAVQQTSDNCRSSFRRKAS